MNRIALLIGIAAPFALATACMPVNKASRQGAKKVDIIGGLADVDAEEAATEEKTGEKGKVRVICRWETATGTHFRKRRCYLVSQADRRRANDQDAILRGQQLRNVSLNGANCTQTSVGGVRCN